MGVSSKFVAFMERLYDRVESAVWNGEELSDYFKTYSGVKQGCLLSPILFALFLNDMHDYLDGGLQIDEINLRILMYADDVVILAEEPTVLQTMITNLELFCTHWGMTVNLTKSKILVFRNGGRLGKNEHWIFNGNPVEIVSNYEYLGVIFTPKLSFQLHLEERSRKAKMCVNGIWQKFLTNENISMQLKISIFQSVIRSIQCYACQVFGYDNAKLVDKLQLYFLKNILKIPEFSPAYGVFLETKQEPTHLYTLRLHMNYIYKTIFLFNEQRLPHKLSLKIIEKKLFWYKEWCNMESYGLVSWNNVPLIVKDGKIV